MIGQTIVRVNSYCHIYAYMIYTLYDICTYMIDIDYMHIYFCRWVGLLIATIEFTSILWMQIGKRDYFVTFGDALHHIVAAILAATHHRHHSHFDWFLCVCVCVWVSMAVFVCFCACVCVLVLFGFLVCVARLARVCAHLVCLLTRLVYYIKNVVSSINTEGAVLLMLLYFLLCCQPAKVESINGN